MHDDYSYLTIKTGDRSGTNFMLDPTVENRIGRGADCEVVLVDPICSRVHARLIRKPDGWWLQDAGSRNGSFVNDESVDLVKLSEGNELKFGSTSLVFHRTDEPPTRITSTDSKTLQTIVKETAINPRESGHIVLSAIERGEFAPDLAVLYQLSLKLLGFDDSMEGIRESIELLHERTNATYVGFMWVDDEKQLRPMLVLPENAPQISLSESLTNVVCQHARAVWVSDSSSEPSQSLRPYSDAMCVPLVRDGATVGAIHLYLSSGRFRQYDFDFAISVANLLAVALVRARKQASLEADNARLVASSASFDELLGESPPMLTLKDKIKKVALASGSVLVRGESGVGKELVSRALHKAGPRSDRPLLSVNCAAIPSELLESQLFGHVKGSFTGAESDHAGWFRQADTGTLFLDEIGELPLEGQAKLLRILEGHSFLPVGGSKEVSVDVRIIAATNRDLKEFVQDRRFREDLYYRLSVFELEVPPLRDRGDDIRMLTEHFLDTFRKKHGRTSLQLSDAARDKVLSYGWPGNVRQLRNVIDSAVVLADGDKIVPEDLGLNSGGGAGVTTLKISDWEQKLIRDALKRTAGKVPEAAKLLGIGRATLYRKLDDYDIDRNHP